MSDLVHNAPAIAFCVKVVGGALGLALALSFDTLRARVTAAIKGRRPTPAAGNGPSGS